MLVGAGLLGALLELEKPRTRGEPDEAVERVDGDAELHLNLLSSFSRAVSSKSLDASIIIVSDSILSILFYNYLSFVCLEFS